MCPVESNIGVGCVLLGIGLDITYPNSSSGPFHHCTPLASNPEVGKPIAKSPTCSVPGIGVNVGLYAKGLVVAIIMLFL
jgi:hypothetical protein